VTQLSDAVTAVNLFPAGDPALACSMSQTAAPTAASGNGPQDYVVGGGQAAGLNFSGACARTSFSVSAHSPDTATSPPSIGTPTTGGTFNLTNPDSVCTPGHVVSKIDCVQVGVSPGRAQLTAVVTQSDGIFATTYPAGSEIQVDLFDSGKHRPGSRSWTTSTWWHTPR
jgi:hypothetical protein